MKYNIDEIENTIIHLKQYNPIRIRLLRMVKQGKSSEDMYFDKEALRLKELYNIHISNSFEGCKKCSSGSKKITIDYENKIFSCSSFKKSKKYIKINNNLTKLLTDETIFFDNKNCLN
jgi:hypothetical protein